MITRMTNSKFKIIRIDKIKYLVKMIGETKNILETEELTEYIVVCGKRRVTISSKNLDESFLSQLVKGFPIEIRYEISRKLHEILYRKVKHCEVTQEIFRLQLFEINNLLSRYTSYIGSLEYCFTNSILQSEYQMIEQSSGTYIVNIIKIPDYHHFFYQDKDIDVLEREIIGWSKLRTSNERKIEKDDNVKFEAFAVAQVMDSFLPHLYVRTIMSGKGFLSLDTFGKKVVCSDITIISEPQYKFDREAIECKKKVLINRGILTDLIATEKEAEKLIGIHAGNADFAGENLIDHYHIKLICTKKSNIKYNTISIHNFTNINVSADGIRGSVLYSKDSMLYAAKLHMDIEEFFNKICPDDNSYRWINRYFCPSVTILR